MIKTKGHILRSIRMLMTALVVALGCCSGAAPLASGLFKLTGAFADSTAPVKDFSAYVADEKILDIPEEAYAQKRDDRTSTWSETAWRRDARSSKIGVVTREHEVRALRISASDFATADGKVLSADNVDVGWLRTVDANDGRNVAGQVKSFPDIIYGSDAKDVPAKTLQFAWLTINVPEQTLPGTYVGRITVAADSDESYTFTYTLEVLDLIQPTAEEVGFDLQIWQHPFSNSGYYFANSKQDAARTTGTDAPLDTFLNDEHKSVLRGPMTEYANQGGHDLVANIVDQAWNHQSYYGDPTMVTWTRSAAGWSFDYAMFDRWIAFARECGIIDPARGIGQIKCYSIVPWENQVTYIDQTQGGRVVKKSLSPGSEEWRSTWTAFLTDFAKHIDAQGLSDVTYIAMDERPLSQLKPAVELITSVKDEKGRTFKISSALNYQDPQDYRFTDKIGDISISLSNIDDINTMRALSDHRRSKGLKTTFYTCTGDYPTNFMISDPGDNYWDMWYTMTAHADGYMRWAWDNWINDMFGTATNRYWEPGDGWFIYPLESAGDLAMNPQGFYSTPRYEMFKQGIRDVAKARFLERDPTYADQIRSLTESMRRPAPGKHNGSTVPADEKQRMLAHAETARIYAGVTDLARRAADSNRSDKTALKDVIAVAERLDAAGYTKESWQAFEAALAKARAIDADDAASQEEVDAAAKDLHNAIEALRADKSELKQAVDDAIPDSESGLYTTTSWKVYQQALAKAREVLADERATKDDVSRSLVRLRSARDGLERTARPGDGGAGAGRMPTTGDLAMLLSALAMFGAGIAGIAYMRFSRAR